MKMNNRSPKPRYSKYKKCRNLMLFIKMNESKPIKNEKKKKKEKIWKPDENEKQIGLGMDINIVNIKMSLSMMMLICIKQHLRKIWSLTLEKGKQYWGWVEKKFRL